MPGRKLRSQSQKMVLSLLRYFEREKEHGGPLISLNAVQERVAETLNINLRTVYTVKKRNTINPILSSPVQKRHRKKSKTADLDECIKMEVRNTLYDMYKQKRHVTVKLLNKELKNKIHVTSSTSSLRSLLLQLGFKFKNLA